MSRSITRISLGDQVTDAIIDLIRERNLKEGDQIPSSNELAAMLKVSLPVVREAVAGLSAIGLLERHQGRESTVAMPNSTHLSRLFSLRVMGSSIDDPELQDFREIVEVGNARLAARNRSEEQLRDLDAALAVLNRVKTAEALHAADVEFHMAVARAAGNDLCALTLESLEPLLRRLRRRIWNGWVTAGGGVESINQAHAAILKAIRAGDAAEAAAAMARHLAQARSGLDESLRRGPVPTAPEAGFSS
jgi:GntR family transcriptional repressor for pyruvate dehydrogenase complex